MIMAQTVFTLNGTSCRVGKLDIGQANVYGDYFTGPEGEVLMNLKPEMPYYQHINSVVPDWSSAVVKGNRITAQFYVPEDSYVRPQQVCVGFPLLGAKGVNILSFQVCNNYPLRGEGGNPSWEDAWPYEVCNFANEEDGLDEGGYTIWRLGCRIVAECESGEMFCPEPMFVVAPNLSKVT